LKYFYINFHLTHNDDKTLIDILRIGKDINCCRDQINRILHTQEEQTKNKVLT
jgi:hypothetical protein